MLRRLLAAAPGASEGIPLRDSPPPELTPFQAPAPRVLPSNRPSQHIVLLVDDPAFAQVLRARHARDGLLAGERGATAGASTPTSEVLVTAPGDDLQTLLAAFAEFEAQCTARAGDQPCPVLRFLDLRSRAVAPE